MIPSPAIISEMRAGKHPYETPDGTEYPNGTLTMATNAQFDPYEYYDGDQIVGIDADIAKSNL